MSATSLMLLAWGLEVAFGWPDWLYRRVRHPVVWIGALIVKLEQCLNRVAFSHTLQYVLGAVTTLIVVGITTGIAFTISSALPDTAFGFGIQVAIASSLLASRSLYIHVQQVAAPLVRNDLVAARESVSQIVGRDSTQLDASGIASASLESLAENASDGIVAPLFWGVIFGLPGIAAYKSINTLDSMIGHRSKRYLYFGGFAARLDDAVNLIPARLTGLSIALSSGRTDALRVMFKQARQHRSPNAGWPEAAMAGGLQVRLSGPRYYGGTHSNEPWLNPEGADPQATDVKRGLKLYVASMLLCALILMMTLTIETLI